MSLIKGGDLVLSVFIGGFYKQMVCLTNSEFDHTTEIIDTSVSGAGNFKTFVPTRDGWTVNANGIVSLEEVNKITLPELRALQVAHENLFLDFTRTSISGQTYRTTGYAIIVDTKDGGSYDGMDLFNISLVGNGPYTDTFVPSPINPPNCEMRLEFTLPDGADTYTNSLLIGKKINQVIKQGLGIDKIILTGTPNPDEVLSTPSTGTIKTGTTWSGDENGYIIYQDM